MSVNSHALYDLLSMIYIYLDTWFKVRLISAAKNAIAKKKLIYLRRKSRLAVAFNLIIMINGFIEVQISVPFNL